MTCWNPHCVATLKSTVLSRWNTGESRAHNTPSATRSPWLKPERKMWTKVKGQVVSRNVTCDVEAVKRLCEEIFHSMGESLETTLWAREVFGERVLWHGCTFWHCSRPHHNQFGSCWEWQQRRGQQRRHGTTKCVPSYCSQGATDDSCHCTCTDSWPLCLPSCPFHLFPLLLWRFPSSQLFCVHYSHKLADPSDRTV
jgi:hypothetical protein